MNKYSLPTSQFVPVHPGRHWHMYDPSVLIQLAPLRHGLPLTDRHSSLSMEINREPLLQFYCISCGIFRIYRKTLYINL